MSFSDILAGLDLRVLRERQLSASPTRVAALLGRDRIPDADLPLLFSPAADEFIEQMAKRAALVTAHRFGRVIQLYAPLYLSNYCVNDCRYCGFSRRNRIERRKLSTSEARREAEALHDRGFRHVLLVTGEAARAYSLADLEDAVGSIADRFSSIGIEVWPMDETDYRRLAQAGVDSLTLYQETYDRALYATLHTGPKADFDGRLDSIEAGGRAGFRTLGIGALLGLSEWRTDAAVTALHARYLAKRFWKSRIAVSFPRLRPMAGGYSPTHLVSDRDLVHMLVATRIAMPDAELVVSTREPGELRDRLIPLGVTRMSAGSRTDVGGYRDHGSGEQFSIDDQRGPEEVAAAIEHAGREAVWKDFDAALREGEGS